MAETEIENSPDTGDVATNCGIHEAREEWNVADVQQAVFRINPRPGSGFEQLHNRPDNVKYKNYSSFAKSFKTEQK